MDEHLASPTPPGAYMPYVWAALLFALLGGLFILGILFLRPNVDVLILITTVFGMAGTMFTGVAAFLKSNETNSRVNGQLSAWKKEFYQLAHSKGVIEGIEAEQARIAEQLRLKLIAESVPVAPDATVMVTPSTKPVKEKLP